MKSSAAPNRSFQAPATIQKLPNSHVYLFKSGESDSDDSEEELDIMELRARGKEQQRSGTYQEKVGDVVLLERKVLEGDSINKLALQYGCKVADLKRVNNFIQEQDLYALKSIKIPVKVNGILTENSKEWQAAHQGTGPLDTTWSESEDGGNSCAEDKQIDQYFRGIDQKIEAATHPGVSLSMNYCIQTPNHSPLGQKDKGGGVDCGIQWWNAVCVMLLVGIVLPVFYIVYFKSQEHELAPSTSNITLLGNATLPAALEKPQVATPVESARPDPVPKARTSVPAGG